MSLASHVRKDVGRTLRDKRGLALAVLLPAVILGVYSALDLDAFSAFGRDPDALILALSTTFPALLASSTALVEERRLGTFSRLARSPASTLAVVAGKTAGGFVVVALQALVLLALSPFLLGEAAGAVPHVMPALLLLLVLSGLCAHALGLLVSALVSTEAQAMQLTALGLLVMITLSGFLQPLAELGTLGAAAEGLPVSLGYASLQALFESGPYGAQAVFFALDILAFVLLAAVACRFRR